MAEPIDWKVLASHLNTLRNGGECSDDYTARQALEILLGEENLRHAVEHYISGKPGRELARSVLREIRPWSAMKHCYDVYKSDADISVKALAVELLRVVADRRALRWVAEFLDDDDSGIQVWGIGVLEQLLYSGLINAEESEGLVVKAEKHVNPDVRVTAEDLREYLLRVESSTTMH